MRSLCSVLFITVKTRVSSTGIHRSCPQGTEWSLVELAQETAEEKDMLEASREKSRAMGLEDASNPDFKSRLDHFLKSSRISPRCAATEYQPRFCRLEPHDPSALVGTAIVQSILDRGAKNISGERAVSFNYTGGAQTQRWERCCRDVIH